LAKALDALAGGVLGDGADELRSALAERFATDCLAAWTHETRSFLDAACLHSREARTIVSLEARGNQKRRLHLWPEGGDRWLLPRSWKHEESQTECGAVIRNMEFRPAGRGEWAFYADQNREQAEWEAKLDPPLRPGEFRGAVIPRENLGRLCEMCAEEADDYPETLESEEYDPLPEPLRAEIRTEILARVQEELHADKRLTIDQLTEAANRGYREALLRQTHRRVLALGPEIYARCFTTRIAFPQSSDEGGVEGELNRDYRWTGPLSELLNDQDWFELLDEELEEEPPVPDRWRRRIGPKSAARKAGEWFPDRVKARLRARAETLRPPPPPKRPRDPRRTTIPREAVLEVWERDGGACVYCDCTEKLHIDHLIPVSKGGSNHASNLQLLCAECNLSKGARI
jgi:hypothetical protein